MGFLRADIVSHQVYYPLKGGNELLKVSPSCQPFVWSVTRLPQVSDVQTPFTTPHFASKLG